MSTTFYYSKINLESHINEVYKGNLNLKTILNLITDRMNDGIECERNEIIMTEEGELEINAKYNFGSLQKLGGDKNYAVAGYLYKEAPVYLQTLDKNTKTLKKHAEDNTEAITFFFDVQNEKVMYHRTKRFGHKEFNIAFEMLINECLKNDGITFRVDSLMDSMKLDEIKTELKKLGTLQMVEIDIKAPNPSGDLLDKITKNGEEYLEDFKSGNITERSVILKSKSEQGLNLDSDVINQELDKIGSIHSALEADEAIKNGYVEVSAEAKNGRTYTTKEGKPLTKKLKGSDRSLSKIIAIGLEFIRMIN